LGTVGAAGEYFFICGGSFETNTPQIPNGLNGVTVRTAKEPILGLVLDGLPQRFGKNCSYKLLNERHRQISQNAQRAFCRLMAYICEGPPQRTGGRCLDNSIIVETTECCVNNLANVTLSNESIGKKSLLRVVT